MISVALLSGAAVVAGLLLAVSGFRPVADDDGAGRTPSRRRDIPSPERVGFVVVAFFAVLLFTRWPVAALASAFAAWLASSPKLRDKEDPAAKAEALTVWAEMLRDATGTPRGIEGVLVATADGAPALIRPHVLRLARRLPYEPLDVALEGLASDLDHPVGDLVATALRLSAQAGGRQIRAVLDDLATVAREEARMHRRLEVARAKPRSDMRSVLLIMAGFVVGFAVLAQRYLEPYRSASGQVVLLVVLGIWGASGWAMMRMGRSDTVERFLAEPAEPVA